jgi:hypothetical protein
MCDTGWPYPSRKACMKMCQELEFSLIVSSRILLPTHISWWHFLAHELIDRIPSGLLLDTPTAVNNLNITRLLEVCSVSLTIWFLRAPHTYSFTFSFNCAVRSRMFWKFRTFVLLKFLDCVTFATAEDLTAQFTLDCSVCCILKAEVQFVYTFNAVNIT